MRVYISGNVNSAIPEGTYDAIQAMNGNYIVVIERLTYELKPTDIQVMLDDNDPEIDGRELLNES